MEASSPSPSSPSASFSTTPSPSPSSPPPTSPPTPRPPSSKPSPPTSPASWRPVLSLLYRKLHVAVYHSSLSGPSRDHLVRGPGPAGTGDCKLNEENGRHPREQLLARRPASRFDERTPVPVGSALPQRRLLGPSERRRPAVLPARGVPGEDQGRGASSAAVGAAGGGAAARVHGRVPDALRLELRAGELGVRRADDRVAAVRGTEDERGDAGGGGGRGAAAGGGARRRGGRRVGVGGEAADGSGGRKEGEEQGTGAAGGGHQDASQGWVFLGRLRLLRDAVDPKSHLGTSRLRIVVSRKGTMTLVQTVCNN
ncbi:unnamed protein product [Musa acuminata subsp. malaccensis]|uniref:(wild Malaysian banana) hypothetical protein n=1 Tax=Musa acuminata subsp. malaccensis TaxID=214687 RepID=A0A804IJ29_MUSAM|nr:unnamed protein product [Musa acuminata subsp. malaccensis]